ncbi:keratin-associated protein 9-2-like [Chironomus tepperi]|uniref:keratin-associated protein 9-2-like n=1 Tax=Chironomus tepperi TaxID=113505 RepID=UPI00391FA6CF
MKYLLLTLLLVHAAYAEFDSEPEYADVEVEIESAQWGAMGCGQSCGCRQRCAMVWWMPCNCPPCRPSCGCCSTTTTSTTTTTTPTTPTTTPTTPTTTPTTPGTTSRPCNNCCNRCTCSPCMMPVMWMCPPRCGAGCCGGSSSCCNSVNRSCCNMMG